MSSSVGTWLTDPDTTEEELEEAAEIARQTQQELEDMKDDDDPE